MSRSEEFWPRCAVVQCEIDVSIGIRRRSLGHHHTRSEHGQDRSELPEPARHVFDAMTLGEQKPLRRAEEAAAVRGAGLGKHVVVVEEEGSAKKRGLPSRPVIPVPSRMRQGWPVPTRSRPDRRAGRRRSTPQVCR